VVAELEALAARYQRGLDDLLLEWPPVLMADLDLRLLLPRPEVAGGEVCWPQLQRPDVAALRRELRRLVVVWHDEAVRAGTTDLAELERVLRARQTAWETTPHPFIGGRTPEDRVREQVRELEARLAAEMPLMPMPWAR